MLPARVALVTKSTKVDYSNLARVAQALNLQVSRDLAPLWNVAGTVVALESVDRLDPGLWPVYVVDEVPEGTAGFHLTEHNQPYAIVQSGDTWSISASHEVLEMLVDPSGNRLTASNAVTIIDNEVQDGDGKVEYLVEICDPSEDAAYAYLIDEVLVSDFYTPHYFDPAGSSGARYSFSGRISRPRQVLPNGYLTWFDLQTQMLRQVRHFGAPEIVDLAKAATGAGSLTGGRSLRSFVDAMTLPPQHLSRITKGAPAVENLEARRAMFSVAAPVRGAIYTAALEGTMREAADEVVQRQADAGSTEAAENALKNNVAVFAVEGVLSVRVGIRWRISSAIPQHVIVVVVQVDRFQALRSQLPAMLDNVPVDVREANPMEQMRVLDPTRYLTLAEARQELRQPDFDSEIFFDDRGEPIDSQPASLMAFAAARARKEEIPYTAAPEASLDAVTAPVTLVLHASPDAAWEQLSEFLAGVREDLVVGMYDFTSAHVLTAVEQALAGGKKMTLTLDHPAKNATADQTDEQTQSDLSKALGDDFEGTWALTNSDPKAPVWIYPNAYHIKVAVREDDTFWLSSGNWNNSNQPEIDLSDPTSARAVAMKSDRDWHVIASSKELGPTFRAFLQHDFDVASKEIATVAAQAAVGGSSFNAGVLNDGIPIEMFAVGKAPQQFFTPRTISDTIRIQPLLTPDNYQEHVLELITSARSSFYMQTQYIHPSGRPQDEKHDALIAAVKDLISRGIDVRLITSQFQTNPWVEKLVGAGIPTSVLRRQANVHNKGIVVDAEKVMVGSQNWSADGTLRNRDAGLIIYHADAASYFQKIFLHDWDYLSSPVSG
ncbi:phospholipase D-like domain-containing protein [Burkholderia cenocepacia]|uniref:phospholipase D-like domain-containing protein n=1 Tax=Burkholderia cenocepacia TaxID=95486 RepID=UPI0016279D6E|nr:phospholipase D-like domain-containing protein [Burkholderia cenocepacia]